MIDPISPEDERRLAECLRREAEEERPAFSETLHRRIVEALPSREAMPRPGGARRPAPRLWLAAALVAGVAVAAVLVVSQVLDHRAAGPPTPDETAVVPKERTPHERVPHEREPSPEPDAGEQNALDPLGAVASGTPVNVDRLVDATLGKSKWAYLDHDARLAANLMLDQIPLDLGLWDEEIEQ